VKRIQAEKISKKYGKAVATVNALREVSFTSEAGEFTI
jgi:ABC-type Na+ transport system ATPase subunit NatA